jgi:hypothetical protein
MPDFCPHCHSLLIQGVCTYRQCPGKDEACYCWIIGGQEYRFRERLTRAEAERAVSTHDRVVLKNARYMYRG